MPRLPVSKNADGCESAQAICSIKTPQYHGRIMSGSFVILGDLDLDLNCNSKSKPAQQQLQDYQRMHWRHAPQSGGRTSDRRPMNPKEHE